MPVVFPPGSVALPPGSPNPLAGTRITSFVFDLLGRRFDDLGNPIPEAYLGTLEGVEPSGSVTWNYRASIKGGGTITVTDVGQDVDWINVRIRPIARIAAPDGQFSEFPCGVFLPAAPVEEWSSTGRRWKVELLDKCSILDQDVVADENGNAITFALPAGSNVIDSVKELIEGTGESADAIEPDARSLANAMTWDVGTTRLKIINDLLDALSYFSLWCDGYGKFRATPYLVPSQRAPVYLELQPFVSGDTSILLPEWTKDRDIYSVPNRLVVIGQGDAENPALTSTAVNTDPESPFSYPARGRWITQVLTGVEAVDQAAMDDYALRSLTSATSVTSYLSIKHPILPDLLVNNVVRFTNADVDSLFTVTNTEITFNPTELASTSLTEVTGSEVNEEP